MCNKTSLERAEGNMKKVVISGMIGNALEWYDYALYAQFTAIIAFHFFPAYEDPLIPTIFAFGVFAAGFIVRPIGGILFGYIGDKYGRRISLFIAIILMAVPTACIGLLPTYNQIGIAAPILLIIIRVLQGLSLGGEFSGCIAYLVEHSSSEKRGLVGSAAFVSMCLGMLIGSVVATTMSCLMDEQELYSWGWRVPFIVSIIFGLIGLHIRYHLSESPAYLAMKKKGEISEQPIKELIMNYRGPLFMAMAIYLTVTVPFYTLTVFINTFAHITLKYSMSSCTMVNNIGLIILILVLPISAYISDRIGRKPVMVAGCLAIILFIVPIFLLMTAGRADLLVVAQALFALIVGIFMGPVPTTLVELFPAKIRFTGIALSYNISAGIFGGTVPAVSLWLIHQTKLDYSVSFYILFFALVTGLALFGFKETYRKKILG